MTVELFTQFAKGKKQTLGNIWEFLLWAEPGPKAEPEHGHSKRLLYGKP